MEKENSEPAFYIIWKYYNSQAVGLSRCHTA